MAWSVKRLMADVKVAPAAVTAVVKPRGEVTRLLASERLFARSDQMTTLDAIRDAEISPLPSAVPAGYRAFVEHLLARDPDARPRSAAAARAELNLALKQPNNGKVQSGVFGRLFGKRAPEAAAAKRLSIADPRAERAQLVALAMR